MTKPDEARTRRGGAVELSFPHLYTEEHLAKRREAIRQREGDLWKGVDATDPQGPSGHARGIQTSVRLTSNYRESHRKAAVDIKPQEVIDVLTTAGIKRWVLMGLHGYVGYMPQPRATQDVDVLISQRDRKHATKAVESAWPTLIVEWLEPVVRFKDPQDYDPKGHPRPVVDLMLTWSELDNAILNNPDFQRVDEETQHVIPTIESALASKYAAIISDRREWEEKEYFASDFRRIARTNYEDVHRDHLRALGNLVWPGGGAELEEFFDIAQRDEPFPI